MKLPTRRNRFAKIWNLTDLCVCVCVCVKRARDLLVEFVVGLLH
jgi:hypothetical protein